MEWNITNDLQVVSLTTYDRDHSQNGGGGGQISPRANIPFLPYPGMPFSVPQIANGAPLSYYTEGNYDNLSSQEISEELRLVSSFAGPVNFSVGGIYLHNRRQDNVFIFDNADAFYGTSPLFGLNLPIDNNPPSRSDGGHYYYQSVNPVTLDSTAAFGEVYWDATDNIRLTGGLRYTDDRKNFANNDSAANLLSPTGGTSYGQGYVFNPPGGQVADYRALTGRFNVDWRPTVDFTDATLLYASYSRGYKSGGFNPPNIVPESPYAPEYVDAYEIGTKNELLDHTLILNLTGFFYNYKGYQFTQAAGFGTVTSNVDAHIFGTEFESKWSPVTDLLFNAQIGYLNTEIQNGPNANSIDSYNPTQGIPNFYAVKSLSGMCVVNATNFGGVLNLVKAGVLPSSALFDVCDTPALTTGFGLFNGVPAADQGGVPVSIAGNRLPNVPDLTVALGAQYTFHFDGSWDLTPRADYRYRGGIYTDLFNNKDLRVRPYDTVNLTLSLDKPDWGFSMMVYAQNLGVNGTIVGLRSAGGAITGSENYAYISDPPLYGVTLTKHF
ncbi:MAG: TonB-dependent receptor [Rhizomicrobium sp.]